jgi:hypothetical protein
MYEAQEKAFHPGLVVVMWLYELGSLFAELRSQALNYHAIILMS